MSLPKYRALVDAELASVDSLHAVRSALSPASMAEIVEAGFHEEVDPGCVADDLERMVGL
jgi:hypothetical protein